MDTITLTIPADWSVTANGHTITAKDLTTETAIYLLSNGFTQSISDAGAVQWSVVNAARVKKGEEPIESDEEKADYIATRRAKRFDDILSGTIRQGGATGPRLKGLDWYIADVGEKFFAAAVARAAKKANAKAPPKSSELYKEKLAAWKVRPEVAQAIREEAERQFANAQALEVDL